MKGTDVNTRLLQVAEDRYANERDMRAAKDAYDPNVKRQRPDIDDVPLETQQPRGIADLGREDFVEAGRACDYDYVFLITLTEGHSRVYHHVLVPTIPPVTDHTTHSNIWLRPDMSIDEAILYIRRQIRDELETIYYIYVLDHQQHLLGVVSFK